MFGFIVMEVVLLDLFFFLYRDYKALYMLKGRLLNVVNVKINNSEEIQMII